MSSSSLSWPKKYHHFLYYQKFFRSNGSVSGSIYFYFTVSVPHLLELPGSSPWVFSLELWSFDWICQLLHDIHTQIKLKRFNLKFCPHLGFVAYILAWKYQPNKRAVFEILQSQENSTGSPEFRQYDFRQYTTWTLANWRMYTVLASV
jgi:hypothetical protein